MSTRTRHWATSSLPSASARCGEGRGTRRFVRVTIVRERVNCKNCLALMSAGERQLELELGAQR